MDARTKKVIAETIVNDHLTMEIEYLTVAEGVYDTVPGLDVSDEDMRDIYAIVVDELDHAHTLWVDADE